MLLKSVNLYQQAGAGYELVWDFSNLKYLGQEKAVCFIGGETGNVKTPNQNSEKPGAKGFDYDTWWQIIYKFFQ